jgi:serine/threonine-protein kinase
MVAPYVQEGRREVRAAGRYLLSREIATGGMGTVHLGGVLGAAGFRRTVAIKRLHPHLAKDAEFLSMFVDEARLAARIHHPNVVGTIDVACVDGELLLVMEYVHGESLSYLLRAARERGEPIPLPVVSAILVGVLDGLHAAHEARDEHGRPLAIVHRDVSPQNVLVAVEGIARVLDFGIAKAAGRLQLTRDGQIKGKPSYMSPEQIEGRSVDRRADVYSAAVILWEMLVGAQLFRGDSDTSVLREAMSAKVAPPSTRVAGLPASLDAITMRGIERERGARYASAREMAQALEAVIPPATPRQLAEWVKGMACARLEERARHLAEFEELSYDVAGHGSAMSPHEADVEPPTIICGRDQRSPAAVRASEVDGGEGLVLARPPSSSDGLAWRPGGATARKLGFGHVVAVASAALVTGGVAALWAAVSVGARSTDHVAVASPSARATLSADPPATQAPSFSFGSALFERAGPELRSTGAATATAPAPTTPAIQAASSVRLEVPAARVPATAPVRSHDPQPGGPPLAAATARAAVPGTTRDKCSPPFTVDRDGIQHLKPECL